MKVRDLLALIEADGWRQIRSKGSPRQFRHDTKAGVVGIAGHPGADIAPGTLNNVLKQAGLKK